MSRVPSFRASRTAWSWGTPAPVSRRVRHPRPGPTPTLIALTPQSEPPLAPGVARGDGAVGFRCSSHPDAQALASVAEREGIGPLTATSLNQSGEPDILDREAARDFCGGSEEAALLAGRECGRAAPSTVVDCTSAPPTLLRDGPLARSTLEQIAGPLAG